MRLCATECYVWMARCYHECTQAMSQCTALFLLYTILNKTGTVDKLSKILKYFNLAKTRPVGDELFHADRRTDTTKFTDAFAIA